MEKDLLTNLVFSTLSNKGFDKLSQEDQDRMLPQFVSALENRLGAELLPSLDEAGAKEFAKLMEGEPTGEDWYGFWSSHVPDFEEKVKVVIVEFADQLKR